jgi:hypothetical protein
MAGITGKSGPGYAYADMSGWPGGAGAGGGGDMFGLDPNMLREAMLEGLWQRREAFGEGMLAKKQTRKLGAKRAKWEEEDRSSALERRGRPQRRDLAREREVAQTQAVTGRVPATRVFIGGSGFDTPDPLKMTGAQRQMFLPREEAKMLPSSDDAYSAMMRDQQRRTGRY